MLKIAILESLLNLLILTPLFFLARRSDKESSNFVVVLWFALIYLASNVLTYSLSSVALFPEQTYNWVGKGAATLFLVVCVFLLPGFRKEQFGLTWEIRWEGAKPILTVCAVYLLLRIGLYAFSGEASAAIHPETALFQATLPGLHEELLYRGILLGLLSVWLVRPSWRFANVEVGWPAVITSLLFGLGHGINITGGLDLSVNYFGLVRTTFDGFLFALLVHRTKSILPAVVYHNLLNLIGNH